MCVCVCVCDVPVKLWDNCCCLILTTWCPEQSRAERVLMSSLHSFLCINHSRKAQTTLTVWHSEVRWWRSEERDRCTILQQMVKCSNSCRNSLTQTVSHRRQWHRATLCPTLDEAVSHTDASERERWCVCETPSSSFCVIVLTNKTDTN